jgi:hypothetical protein
MKRRTSEEMLRFAAYTLDQASSFVREHAHGPRWIEMADSFAKASDDVSKAADEEQQRRLRELHNQD